MNADGTARETQIPATEWEALAELSRQEGVPPADLVREAVRRYLGEKNELLKTRQALSKSFGVWRDREDLQRDSLDLVNELREDWLSEREDWGSTSVVIDSDVLIDHLFGCEVAMDFIDSLLLDGLEVCFSVISEAEIYSNVQPGEEPRILTLFESLTRLNLDGVTARKAGEYRLTYLPSDRLALPDALIAATGFVHQAVLLTRNVRHYPMTDVKVVASLSSLRVSVRFLYVMYKDKKVAVLGYAYLENSGDVRNSPSEVLVTRLQKLGAEVVVHDPYVQTSQVSQLLGVE